MINALKKIGVEEIIFCSGSHNAPLILGLLKEFSVLSHFDERGASFYALGRIKATNKPVCVVTTSGTAVAECLPAVIEARYSGLPLLIISADRPKRFIGTGAPQVVNQAELLSSHSIVSAVEGDGYVQFKVDGPSHWNIHLEDSPPSLEVEIIESKQRTEGNLHLWLQSVKAPLVLVEKIPSQYFEKTVTFLEALGAPVYAEPRSNLFDKIPSLIVDEIVDHDSILRIGSVPVTSYWRSIPQNIKVASLAAPFFAGTDHEQLLLPLSDDFLSNCTVAFRFKNKQKMISAKTDFENTVNSIPKGSRIYFGNSLPIRDAIRCDLRGQWIEANRGANGIDGQIATFAGFIKGVGGYAFLGDLTFLYDLPSLTLLQGEECKIFVINNKGGRIFEGLPKYQKLSEEEKKIIVCEQKFNISDIANSFGVEIVELCGK